jgi:hypothetical protein
MSQAYICAVSSRFPENYEIGIRAGKWGVEARHSKRVANVRVGDTLIFLVGGRFRSIHRVTSDVFEERTLLWPLKDGDPFPYRMNIGPAEVFGSVPAAELAPNISFMRDTRAWGGTIQGANGVFNDRATPADVELIRMALMASSVGVPATQPDEMPSMRSIVPVGDYWWPGLLDQLASLAKLHRTNRFRDPFTDATEWRTGLLTGLFIDHREVPTVAIAPFDRSPSDTVLSTLYGLSAVKQSADRLKEVRGVIFVQHNRDEVVRLTAGLPNLSTFGFEVSVALRS